MLATLEQSCVVTGEPVAAAVAEPFALDILPEPQDARPATRSSFDPDYCDIMFHEGATIVTLVPWWWIRLRWRSTPTRAAPARRATLKKRA